MQNFLKDYYKGLFKQYYRSSSNSNSIAETTYDFVYYVLQKPEMLQPLFEFFVKISFEGPDDFHPSIVENILKEKCYLGITRVDINSCFSSEIIKALNPKSLIEAQAFKEEIHYLLEEIKMKDDKYSFYEIDWDFFLMQLHAIQALQILFNPLSKNDTLSPFGEIFKKKAEECGMAVEIDTLNETDIDAIVNAQAKGTNIEKVRNTLQNKKFAFLNFEPLGNFDKEDDILVINKL